MLTVLIVGWSKISNLELDGQNQTSYFDGQFFFSNSLNGPVYLCTQFKPPTGSTWVKPTTLSARSTTAAENKIDQINANNRSHRHYLFECLFKAAVASIHNQQRSKKEQGGQNSAPSNHIDGSLIQEHQRGAFN